MNWSWWTAVLVILIVAPMDFAWAKYQMAFVIHHRPRAVGWNGVIHLLGGMLVVAYTENKWYIIPATLAGMLGTYFAMGKVKTDI